NQFGSIEQDAQRRDFTINALFYDIHQMTIIDYTAGMTDLNDRVVRIIGEANTRYREDPVRILRAIRFKAKLGLAIEEKTASLIAPLAHLLTAIPAARLFDEVLKLYLTGHARSSHQLLVDYQVLDYLFPATVTALTARQETTDRLLIERALYNTDQRITARKPVTPAFLYAVLLWPVLKQKWVAYQAQHPLAVAMQKAAIEVIGQQYKTTAIPKRFAIIVRDIWQLQIKLEQRHGKRAWRTLSHPKFRAGYDFLLLRVEAGEPLAELAQWWTDFQFASSEQQQQQVAAIKPTTQRYRRRQRKKRH
ncbi:MAG TPA: polynucleotide adenylyltransferase PcnB, partial [Gammaproteobacteria bacterium]|nr:polynucleotide adenylyltransferase PcnB [Gammaproteobacteria bacterium]